jgi:hypothetical protein
VGGLQDGSAFAATLEINAGPSKSRVHQENRDDCDVIGYETRGVRLAAPLAARACSCLETFRPWLKEPGRFVAGSSRTEQIRHDRTITSTEGVPAHITHLFLTLTQP